MQAAANFTANVSSMLPAATYGAAKDAHNLPTSGTQPHAFSSCGKESPRSEEAATQRSQINHKWTSLLNTSATAVIWAPRRAGGQPCHRNKIRGRFHCTENLRGDEILRHSTVQAASLWASIVQECSKASHPRQGGRLYLHLGFVRCPGFSCTVLLGTEWEEI